MLNKQAIKNALRLSGFHMTRSVTYNSDWRQHWICAGSRYARTMKAGINMDGATTEFVLKVIAEVSTRVYHHYSNNDVD